MAKEICLESGYGVEEAERVAGLVRKEGLISKKRKEKDGEAGNVGEEEDEVQILEDVACLVFLDDQFEEFEKEHDEEKILGILRKTWGKMGERGRELDLKIEMSGRARELVEKALKG